MKFLSRVSLVVIAAGISGVLPGVAAAPENRPPNLIIILTDDQGYSDVGFNGCKDIPTPNIDRIADEGVRFSSGYVSYSVCGPSRAGLMTGRYQGRFGFTTNPTINPAEKAGIPLSEETLAESLKKAGYRNMAIGKWHLGTHPTLRPLRRGFDEFFGFLSGGHNYFPDQLTLNSLDEVTRNWEWYRTKLLRNEIRVDIDDYLTDALSQEAAAFVDRSKDQPFFLYLAYNAPHTPLQATEKYLKRFDHIKNKKRRTYAAMISAVDDGVGQVLERVHTNGLDEHTLIFFLSDNGGPIGGASSANGSINDPLRGGKGSAFEGGVRVPFAARWTGTLPAGIDYDEPVISLDIFATITALAGVSPRKPLDGVNLVPYLTGSREGPPHDKLMWRFYGRSEFALRLGSAKMILPKKRDQVMLFNLTEDIGEKRNLADQHARTVEEFSRMLDAWNSELKGPAFKGLGSWKR